MRSRRTAVVVLVAALVLLISAFPGRATFSKQYTLNIAPATVTSGNEVTFTATYKGKSSFGIGSSNLSVPSAFTGVTLVSFVANKGTATVVGNTVQLRQMSLGNNKIATVTLKATVPCGPATYNWSAITKSSSTWSGGADFTMIAPSSTTTTASGQCSPDSIRFVAGSAPTDAIAGDRISDTAFDPNGGDVLVEAIRNGSRLTSFTGPISLGVTGGSGTATGAGPIAAVNGVATFDDFRISEGGTYQVTPTSGSLTGSAATITVSDAGLACGDSVQFTGAGKVVTVNAPDIPSCEGTVPINVDFGGDRSVTLSKPDVSANTILTMTIVWDIENAQNPLPATLINYTNNPLDEHPMVFCNPDNDDDDIPEVPNPTTEPWCVGSQTVVPAGPAGNVRLTEFYVGQGDPKFKR